MSPKRLLQATTAAALLTIAAIVAVQPSIPEAQAQSAPNPPVCDRTPQIRDAIVSEVRYLLQIAEVPDCAEVTAEQLARLTNLEANSVGLSELREGDFNGMARLESLWLVGNALTTLPPSIFRDLFALDELHLWNNQLSTLEPGVFNDLTSLTFLDLSINSITSLPDDIFNDLGSLTFLSMMSNNFENLDPNQFQGLHSLEYLSLSGNRLTSLPEGVFKELGALVELELAYNELKTISGDVFQGLTNLEHISLRQNRIQRLPDGMLHGLVSLEEFNAWQRIRDDDYGSLTDLYFFLERLPDSLNDAIVTFPVGAPFDMFVGLSASGGTVQQDGRRILSIRIDKGAVESEPFQIVPDTGADSVTVTITPPDVPDTECESDYSQWVSATPSVCYAGFELHDGQTTPEPPIPRRSVTIWNLVNWIDETSDIGFDAVTKQDIARITEIDIPYHCPGESIAPGDFNDFVNVRRISLPANCDFADLPAGAFSGLPKLEELVLNDVGLQSSDLIALEGLNSLRELSLVGNSFETLDDDAFRTLSALEVLDLSESDITTISEDTFAGLGSLRDLRLNDNALTTLPSGPFSDLANLETLLLLRNDIASLPVGAFDGLDNLETLILGGNEISELESEVFRGLTSLRGLDLAVNEFDTLPDGLLEGLTALEAFNVLGQGPLTTIEDFADGSASFEWVNIAIPVRLVRTQGFAPVARVDFPVGAPWDIEVGLSAVGGTITKNGMPIDSITIPTGHTKSPIFDIEPDDESTRVVVELDPVIGPPGEPGEVVYQIPDDTYPHLSLLLINSGLDIVADAVAPITLPDTGGMSPTPRTIAILLLAGILLATAATVTVRASFTTTTRHSL